MHIPTRHCCLTRGFPYLIRNKIKIMEYLVQAILIPLRESSGGGCLGYLDKFSFDLAIALSPETLKVGGDLAGRYLHALPLRATSS